MKSAMMKRRQPKKQRMLLCGNGPAGAHGAMRGGVSRPCFMLPKLAAIWMLPNLASRMPGDGLQSAGSALSSRQIDATEGIANAIHRQYKVMARAHGAALS